MLNRVNLSWFGALAEIYFSHLISYPSRCNRTSKSSRLEDTGISQSQQCEISNNRAERCAKSYGTGRRNFLFHNSVNGAKSGAVIYSLVETAKANRLNVFQYLYTLLLYMPDYKYEPAGVEAMMPWNDFIKERCSEVMDTETETPENRGEMSW